MRHFGTYKPGTEAESVAHSFSLLRQAFETANGADTSLVGTCWPNSNQTLLFRVLFESPSAAVDAWTQWRTDNDPDSMDVPSMRLVPQLHRRLRQLGVDDPWMPKFKGSYRKTWTNNQRMLLHALPTLTLFSQARIAVMALKGLAITLQYLGADFGLRSMYDLDLLVHTKRAQRAIDALTSNGWHFKSGRSIEYLKQKILPKENGRAFVKELGEVDLHWHMLHQDPSEWMDAWVWKGARAAHFRGHHLNIPSPTALLVNVCLHGVKYCASPSIMWAADVLCILRASTEDIDWPGIVELAGRRRLALPLLDSLSYVNTVMPNAVPESVLDGLRALPTSLMERIEYQAITRASSSRDQTERAAMNYLVALRQRYATVEPTAQFETHTATVLKAVEACSRPALARACSIRTRW